MNHPSQRHGSAGATGSIRISGTAPMKDSEAVSTPFDSTNDHLIAFDDKAASQFSQSDQSMYKSYLFNSYTIEQRSTWTVQDKLGKTESLKAHVNGKTVKLTIRC